MFINIFYIINCVYNITTLYRNYSNNYTYLLYSDISKQTSTTIRRALLKHYKAQIKKNNGKVFFNINLSK